MDLKQQIRQRPMTGFQWLVVALAVALNMLDGFDVLAVAFTAKSIKSELGLTGGQIGSLMSAGFVGMTVGSLLLGPLADRLGVAVGGGNAADGVVVFDGVAGGVARAHGLGRGRDFAVHQCVGERVCE